MHAQLTQVIEESGIWSGSRRKSHAFLLSPEVYRITEEQRTELEVLGRALGDCLLGLSHIATIAFDGDLHYGGAWLFARRVFASGVPKTYHRLQGMYVHHVPKLLKIDLMVDQSGNFKIAEIDGHNKHSVGYSTLGRRFRGVIEPDGIGLPGAVKLLAEEVRRSGHTSIKVLYADQERFYIPELEIMQQEFRKEGIDCLIVSEMTADERLLSNGLFIDLPFMYHRPIHYRTMVSAYQRGDVEFIIPPKPFLGAKGVLALLRNDGHDPQLEALLNLFINPRSLEQVRKYIPETWLIGKQAEKLDSIKPRLTERRFVLKESISSGMHGTIFSDQSDFERALNLAANRANMNWILQEEVVNQPQTFSWYEGSNASLHTSSDWFMRVTVQYVRRRLGDIIVTARRDKAVHGGKDCLQIGAVVV